MTTIKSKDIENFLIRLYFGTTDENKLLEAAIDRAYRDFNRTLHGIGKIQTIEKQDNLKKIVKNIIMEVLDFSFNNQNEFDRWHERKCLDLVQSYEVISQHKLFIGQAQKWINMSLKYSFVLGDTRIKNISKNYVFFHFPVDNVIQDKLSNLGVPKFEIKWSRIDDYKDYLDYQKKVRLKFVGQIPLDVEFRLFNS